MTTAHTATLATIRNRLAKLELEHLRTHASELADKVERLQGDLESADVLIDSLRGDVLWLMEEFVPQGGQIRLSKDGALSLVPATTEAGAA